MEIAEERTRRSSRSRIERTKDRYPSAADYYPELLDWVQQAIIEAEKDKNLHKKNLFLSLLKDL